MEKQSKKRQIDLADIIFTQKIEEEGKWVEPEIFGQPIGIEFLIYGANSDKIAVEQDVFMRKLAEIEKIEDGAQKAERTRILYSETAAKRVGGMRLMGDADVRVNGKEIAEYSETLVGDLCNNAPALARFIVSYSNSTGNFTRGRKKN